MKRRLFLLSWFLGTSLFAQGEGASVVTPHISVAGTAVTEVKPDVLQWSVEVRNTGQAVAKVAARHSSVVEQLLATLKELGIEDKHVQTAQVELGANRVYRRNEWVEEGYFAATIVSFKLTNLTRYKDVWIKLAEQGGISVKGVVFDHSKRIDLTKETRIKALQAAKAKAVAMAEALDARVGEVMSIAEEPVLYGSWTQNISLSINNAVQSVQQPGGDGEGGGGVAAGTIPIRARVLVSFRLLNGAK